MLAHQYHRQCPHQPARTTKPEVKSYSWTSGLSHRISSLTYFPRSDSLLLPMHSNPCTFTFLANSAPAQVEDILDILKERMQNVYNGKSWSRCKNSPSVSCFKMSIFLHWRYEWIHNQKRKWKLGAITLLQSMDVLYLLNAHPPLWLNGWSQRYQVQPIQLACEILGVQNIMEVESGL